VVTLFRDPLNVKRSPVIPQWTPRVVEQPSLEYGRRQF
jgi:hypothetical protein